MKKTFWVISLILSVIVSVFLPNYSFASVNDFRISKFDAQYYLSVDDNKRSILKTVETITAVFPDYDQNHGIERSLAITYDGHSTDLNIISVIDSSGKTENYTTYSQDNNLVVRIGDAESYVYGEKTYIITYSQKDVTRYFADTGVDEFYWDINGVSWYQNFDNVSATLHLADNLVAGRSGEAYCYYGYAGSDDKCNVSDLQGDLSVDVDNLLSNQNVSLSVGFVKNTFAPYQMDLKGFIDKYMALISLFVSIVGFFVILSVSVINGKNTKSSHAIVPEYLPPADIDVAVSAVIIGKQKSWVAATLVDLAVRHKIRIIDNDKKKYSVELLNNQGLSERERLLIDGFFGTNQIIGEKYDITKKSDIKLSTKLSAVYRKSIKWADENEYYINKNKLKIKLGIMSLILLIQGVIVSILSRPGITIFADLLIVMAIILSGILFVVILVIKPLSQKGRDLLDYIKGIEMYIKVAEVERIKILQSPEGAERSKIDAKDNTSVVKLYERLLPYAVLLGLEKQWTKTLGDYYQASDTNPDWYSGNGVFNAIAFNSVISNFSSTVHSNSYYASTSSSSGGSGGGGFSGGGGGGGGGGCW